LPRGTSEDARAEGKGKGARCINGCDSRKCVREAEVESWTAARQRGLWLVRCTTSAPGPA